MTAANLLRVRALAFRPDGAMLAVAGDERIVRLWSFPEGKRRFLSDLKKLQGRPGNRRRSHHDRSFNQSAWEGVQQACDTLGLVEGESIGQDEKPARRTLDPASLHFL
jgi:WD40 repeat protein